MSIRVYTIDEHLLCKCDHEWEDHHHGVILNPEYADYPLNIRGCIGQECEYNQFEGYFAPRKDEKIMCTCFSFRPRAINVQKIVAIWNAKHDALRKKNGR